MTTNTTEQPTNHAEATAEVSNVIPFCIPSPAPVAEFQKWDIGADLGPRMATAFKKALSECSSAANGVCEITGIIGKPETERRYTVHRFTIGKNNQGNPALLPKLAEIQAAHGHIVTAANYKRLTAAIEGVTDWLNANPITDDKRETQEAIDERNNSYRKVREEQDRRDAEEKAKKAVHLEAVKMLYPWAQQTGSSQARCAANLKRILCAAFPGVEFSCKSDSASMTSGVRISWTNGPTEREVGELTKHAAYGRFDGMDDSYNCNTDPKGQAWRAWMGDCKYLSETRRLSEESVALVQSEMVGFGFQNTDHYARDSAQSIARSLLACTSLPAGAVITGVRRLPDGESNKDAETCSFASYYALVWTAPAPVAYVPSAADAAPVASGSGVSVRLNTAKGGVELHFTQKPSEAVIESCKRNGFRWAKFTRCWYAKATDEKITAAHRIAGSDPAAHLKANHDEGHRQGAMGMEQACGIA
jgi:hypothetical protein